MCSFTGHEMPKRLEAIQSYLQGKKYKKALMKNQCDLLEKYKEHLVESDKKNHEWVVCHLVKYPLVMYS